MPYCECPNCGQMFHVRAINTENWYKERDLEFGELANEICICCWKPLKEGNKVFEIHKKQKVQNFNTKDIATIVNIEETNRLTMYTIEIADGEKKALTRDKLYYSYEQNKEENLLID